VFIKIQQYHKCSYCKF